MKHDGRKRGMVAACVVALALLALVRVPVVVSPQGSTGTPQRAVLVTSSWHLAGISLNLKIECDTPSGCALTRGLWRAVAPLVTWNGE